VVGVYTIRALFLSVPRLPSFSSDEFKSIRNTTWTKAGKNFDDGREAVTRVCARHHHLSSDTWCGRTEGTFARGRKATTLSDRGYTQVDLTLTRITKHINVP